MSSLKTDYSPDVIAVNPKTNKVYVGSKDSETVSIIDGKKNEILNTVRVNSIRRVIAVNPITNTIEWNYHRRYSY
jgi:YVTN family beta-propeller protein